MMAAGQHDMTKIVGTKGKISVNVNLIINLVELSEPIGIRHEIPPHYYSRFKQAFVVKANEFTKYCLDDKPLLFKLVGTVQAVKIGCTLQESLRTEKKLWFNKIGRRVEHMQL